MEIALLTDFTTLQNETYLMTIADAVKTSGVTRLGKRKLLRKWDFMEACACLS